MAVVSLKFPLRAFEEEGVEAQEVTPAGDVFDDRRLSSSCKCVSDVFGGERIPWWLAPQ